MCVYLDIYAMLEGAFGSYKWAPDILGLELQAVECSVGPLEKKQVFSTAELFSGLISFFFSHCIIEIILHSIFIKFKILCNLQINFYLVVIKMFYLITKLLAVILGVFLPRVLHFLICTSCL